MAATKKEYIKETRAQLDAFEVQIEGLMVQATHSDYDEYLTDIRVQQESAKATLADVEEVRGEAWQDLKSQLDKAIIDIQNALFVITSDSDE
jgi:predicted  nucleic acid-binding Zn-ribbon protein